MPVQGTEVDSAKGHVTACPKNPKNEPKMDIIIAARLPNLSENIGIHKVEMKDAAAYAVDKTPVFALISCIDF